jgi:hypothetical protein
MTYASKIQSVAAKLVRKLSDEEKANAVLYYRSDRAEGRSPWDRFGFLEYTVRDEALRMLGLTRAEIG